MCTKFMGLSIIRKDGSGRIGHRGRSTRVQATTRTKVITVGNSRLTKLNSFSVGVLALTGLVACPDRRGLFETHRNYAQRQETLPSSVADHIRIYSKKSRSERGRRECDQGSVCNGR